MKDDNTFVLLIAVLGVGLILGWQMDRLRTRVTTLEKQVQKIGEFVTKDLK